MLSDDYTRCLTPEEAFDKGFKEGQKQAYEEISAAAGKLAELLVQLQQLEKESTHDGK